MKTQNASADLWANAHKRINAQHGMGDRADAFIEVIPIHKLIETVGSNSEVLAQLARRSGELSEEQRTAVLKAFCPPKEAPKVRKAAKTEPKAKPTARSRFSHLSAARLGFGKGARS